MSTVHSDEAPPGGSFIAIPYTPEATRLRIAGLRGKSQGPVKEPLGYYVFAPFSTLPGDACLIVPVDAGYVNITDERHTT